LLETSLSEYACRLSVGGCGMASASETGGIVRTKLVDAAEVVTGLQRLESIDLLRGLVMVIMAIDHIRDYMTWRSAPPEILSSHNSFALFFTRWITHFCAPTFFFLAGTGAALMMARRSRSEVSHFLWTRGLWLMFLECTVVSFAWTFIPIPFPSILVIFQLGLSMVILAALIHVPVPWLTGFSLLVIATHNLFDRVNAASLRNPFAQIWVVLHQMGQLPPPVKFVFVLYPVVPWFAVMSAGFCFGAIVRQPRPERIRYTAMIGAATTLLFVLLRGFNLYGNSTNPNMFATGPWHPMQTVAMSVAAFLNTTKYPPSLQYLLMTMGPALLALALFDRMQWGRGWLASKLVVFGRVPMFYYICHLYTVHLVALAFALAFHQPAKRLEWMGGGFFMSPPPPGFGFNLPMIYLAWVVSIVILYFPCARYAKYKTAHKENIWLSYL